MKIFSKYKPLLMLAATFLFAACSADEPSLPDPVEPDFEGIVLNISRPGTGTRADGTESITTDEGAIKSLTVFAFPQTGSDATAVVTHIVSQNTLSDTKWTHVKVRLSYNNTYNIYVMANVDQDNLYKNGSPLLASASSQDTDADFLAELKKLKESEMASLSISTEPFGALSETKKENGEDVKTQLHYIPMSCHQSAIKWQIGNGSGNADNPKGTGTVTIKKSKTTTVNATLIFAMAKVNYTLYNGKLSFLKMADNAADRLKIDKYATRVGLIDHYSGTVPTSAADVFASVGDCGQFYKANTTNYPDIPEKDDKGNITKSAGPTEAQVNADLVDTNKLPNNTDANTDAWIYHGTAYVPEYLFGDGATAANQTRLQFTFKGVKGATAAHAAAYSDKTHLPFGGKDVINNPLHPATADASATHTGVIRGVIYDVLIYTTEKEIALKVRVKPWSYARYDFSL